ncbi:glycine/sarcosine/betaine reductase component B subunit [Chloroflexota bacterium]
MRLELADFPVKDLVFGSETKYCNGILEINKEELLCLILKDSRITSASLDVAFPNEQTRIVKIRDVVEPRVKVSGPGCVFPGILGPVETVGEGRTHRLSGVTVIPSAEYSPTIPTGTTAQASGFVDMWGPGSHVTPFASTINIVLLFKLIEDVSELEAHNAIQLAEFTVAHHLAETTRHKTPENIEVFDLTNVDSFLPRVVYIMSCLTEVRSPREIAYYGLSIRESLPTFIHPNELFDGAITTDARRAEGLTISTWEWMNQPVVLGLFKEHGRSLNFVGVILQRTRFETEHGKLVTAACTSQMARLLGADGSIQTTMTPSGNNFMDVMLTLQQLEKKGIRTTLLTPEWGGRDGTELPLVFSVPEATSIVSTGGMERELKLPAPTKVIGCEENNLIKLRPEDEPFLPWSEFVIDGRSHINGGIDWWGRLHITCKDY